MLTDQEIFKATRDCIAAWNTLDLEGTLATYTDDVTYRDPKTSGKIIGKDDQIRMKGRDPTGRFTGGSRFPDDAQTIGLQELAEAPPHDLVVIHQIHAPADQRGLLAKFRVSHHRGSVLTPSRPRRRC